MTTYFYGAALTGDFWRSRNYEPLVIDQESAAITWDAQGKEDIRAFLVPADFVDQTSVTISELQVSLTIANAPSGCRGELVIPAYGATRPIISLADTTEGLFNPQENSILRFRLVQGVFYWESDKDARAYSLADTSPVVFEVDPVNGIDSESSPIKQSLPYTIGLIKRFVPFSRIQPAQDASWSGDRFFAVEIRLHPGTYNSSNFFQYFQDYGIKIVGLGLTPAEVEVFANNSTSAFVVTACSDISFENLRISSVKAAFNILNSDYVHAKNIEFVFRSGTPNCFYVTLLSNLKLSGTMRIVSRLGRFVNCNSKSTVRGSAVIQGDGLNPIEFVDSFVLAEEDGDVYLDNLTFEENTTATGLALIAKDKSIVKLPLLPGLTYA